MAGKTWRQTAVMESLAQKPRDFSFFQAVRLLAHEHLKTNSPDDFFTDFLRIRADLSLSFPETDLVGLEFLPQGTTSEQADQVRLTATFFGLYGSSSPLPTFYTEELLEESSEDETVQRDFLDILGQALYNLYLAAGFRYRLMDKVVSLLEQDNLERLFCLAGLGHPEIRDLFDQPGSLIRVAGLLSQSPRSALGLRCLLRDRFGPAVFIEQCVPDLLAIPENQRCRLGDANSHLGEDLRLGSVVEDCMGRIQINISDLPLGTFRSLCPGRKGYAELEQLVNFYCSDIIDFDLLLTIKPGVENFTCLGGVGAPLGGGAWLGKGILPEGRTFFPARRDS